MDPKDSFHLHLSLPILSQINSVYILNPHFFETDLIIPLPILSLLSGLLSNVMPVNNTFQKLHLMSYFIKP